MGVVRDDCARAINQLKKDIMKTYVVKIKVWMSTGHVFEDVLPRAAERMSLDLIEELMNAKAIKRGFKGLDDIEAYKIEMESYCA